MDALGGVHADAAVAVLGVIPVEVGAAVASCIFNGSKAFGEGGVVFEGFELGFGVRVVVGDVGATVAGGNSKFKQQLLHGGGGHGGATVGMEDGLAGLDAVLGEAILQEVFGELGVLLGGDGPANDEAAEEVNGDVKFEARAFFGSFKVGDVPAPDLIGSGGAEFGFAIDGVAGLIAAFAHFISGTQNAIHGAGGAEVGAFIEQGGLNFSGGAVNKAFGMADVEDGLALGLG